MNAFQQREYIRHPASIPLEVKAKAMARRYHLKVKNVSYGGLSFASPTALEKGSVIVIEIPSVKPAFLVSAIVRWCRKNETRYLVGVRFLDEEDAFRARMVEQVCHIEEYRAAAKREEGRELSENEASIEWIEKHATEFPK
ncbi:MAG: pilus assembly protein PilZ [Proteobacteria bacterium]|nr:MAG: pilus assembly protein PilZ [Pseudomonadota bacterium]